MKSSKTNKVNRINKIKSIESIKSNKVNWIDKIKQSINQLKSCAHKAVFRHYYFLFSSTYIEGLKTKSALNFFNRLCLKKLLWGTNQKNVINFKSRFDGCIKFALKMHYEIIKTQSKFNRPSKHRID